MARKTSTAARQRELLTSANFSLLEDFLSVTLDRYKDGLIGRGKAVADISRVVAIIDRPEGIDVTAFMRAIIKNGASMPPDPPRARAPG